MDSGAESDHEVTATVWLPSRIVAHWGGLAESDLTSAYSGIYTPEYTITLFGRIHAEMIDWRVSLLNSKINSLYQTTFIYSMVQCVSLEHVYLFVRAN